MTADSFACYLVEESEPGKFKGSITRRPKSDLPAGDVTIRVAYSSLNYKDALSATGNKGVTRKFPHVPGIDAAGTIVDSAVANLPVGREVLVTGYDLGQNTWGGFGQFIRVPAGWVVPLPKNLSLRESMIYGTAGFTAAQSVDAIIERGILPENGEVVVSGASGGVGSLAVAILAKLGYQVVASSGKASAQELLKTAGAARIVGREELTDESSRPLLSTQWAAGVDTVGGRTLATMVRSLKRAGCVTACGLVGGTDLPLTVFPFLLRGVALVGIDSAECPLDKRIELWGCLAGPWRPSCLEELTTDVTLDEVAPKIETILKGQIAGRVVVRLPQD